jgi:hypothetical protein
VQPLTGFQVASVHSIADRSLIVALVYVLSVTGQVKRRAPGCGLPLRPQLPPGLLKSAYGAALAHRGLMLNRSIFAVASGMREATDSNSAPIRCSCFAVG